MNNVVMLVGRLTKDIELRYTENNNAVGNFSLAINRDYKNENGEYEVDFIDCVIFNKTAETMSKYSHKGDLIGIRGRLQKRVYENEKGKHYITEVVVEKMSFLSPKKEENEYKDMSVKTEVQQQFEINPEDLPF